MSDASKSNAITVLKNGNTGVGTATPNYKFSVNGLANLNEGITTGAAIRVNGAEALWYNGAYFSWGFGGTANYFADMVGIGESNPNYKLDVKASDSQILLLRFTIHLPIPMLML